jgi:hypothetical protein
MISRKLWRDDSMRTVVEQEAVRRLYRDEPQTKSLGESIPEFAQEGVVSRGITYEAPNGET